VIKNFGKEIIRFINTNEDVVTRILESIGSTLSYSSLDQDLQRNRKHQITKNEHLTDMWTNERNGREVRVISNEFLRKYSKHWIFNSRVTNFRTQLKYKLKLESILRNPFAHFVLKSS
jgi:hypothetical protein